MHTPERWVANIQQLGLSTIAVYYLWRGLAPLTRHNYDTPRERFAQYCSLAGFRHYNEGCFSAKVNSLIEWLCSLVSTGKVKTMKLYLSGLMSYQLDLRIECTAYTDPGLERTIQGIKRDCNQPECTTRTPLTRPHLLAIVRNLLASKYDNKVLRAAFSLAFAGFLRVGEFTYKETDRELGRSYSKWFLAKQSIRVAQGGASMQLTLLGSKTGPFRKGITLTIAATNDAECPVHAMTSLQAIDHHRPLSSPLFCIGQDQQQAFTRKHVVWSLQRLALSAGLMHGT